MGLYLGAQNLLEGVGSVDGTGTPNYLTKWTDADTIEDSIVSDNGAIATVSGALVVTGTIDTPIISAVSLATDANGVIIEGTTGFGVSGTAGTIPVFEAGGDGVGDSLVAQVSTSVPSTPGAITNTNTSILFTNSSGAGDLPSGRAGWITSSFSNYASGFDYSSTAAGFGASVVGFSIEFADAAAATAFLGVASLTGAGTFAAFATTVTVTQNDNATAQFAATHYARQAAVSGGVIIHFTQALNSTTTAITPISGSGTQANVSSTNTIGGATIPAVPGDAIVTVTGDLTVTGKTTLDTTLDGLVLATAGVLSTDSSITLTAGGAGVSATLSEYSTPNVSASADGVVDGLGPLDGIATLGFNVSSATGFTNGQIFTSLTFDYVGTVQGLGSATFTGRWIYLDSLGTGPDGTSTQVSEAILYQALGNGVTVLLDDTSTINFGTDQGLLTGTDFNSITAGQSGGTTITGDLTVTGATTSSGDLTVTGTTTLSGTTTLKIDDTGTGPAQNLQFRIADTGNTGATGFITFVRE